MTLKPPPNQEKGLAVPALAGVASMERWQRCVLIKTHNHTVHASLRVDPLGDSHLREHCLQHRSTIRRPLFTYAMFTALGMFLSTVILIFRRSKGSLDCEVRTRRLK